MDRRLAVLPLLAAAAAVFACGGPLPHVGGELLATVRPGAPDAAPATSAAPAHAPRPHRARGDTLVGAALSVHTEHGIEFALAVENPGKHRVELSFPDGRTKEFVVYDAAGREVWRWSRGRLFTQNMQTKMLASGDSVVYAERWAAPAPGRYTVVAQLRSANYPIVKQTAFVVPATPATGTVAQLAAH